jgi:hypothetical protein
MFAQGLIDEWKLPPALYLPIAAGIAILSAFASRSNNQGFRTIVKAIRNNFVSYKAVDDAAKKILSSIGVPLVFREWVASIVAQIVTTVPDDYQVSNEHLVDIVSTKYSSLPNKEAKKLLPVPDNLAKVTFAKKRIAKTVITEAKIV